MPFLLNFINFCFFFLFSFYQTIFLFFVHFCFVLFVTNQRNTSIKTALKLFHCITKNLFSGNFFLLLKVLYFFVEAKKSKETEMPLSMVQMVMIWAFCDTFTFIVLSIAHRCHRWDTKTEKKSQQLKINEKKTNKKLVRILCLCESKRNGSLSLRRWNFGLSLYLCEIFLTCNCDA